jgi:hypothetical protein
MASETMLAATSILKKPQIRIAKITEDITLPRSISLKSLLVGIAGFIFGVVFYLIFYALLFRFTVVSFFFITFLFSLIAVGLSNYQPLRGENWSSWLNLQVGSARGGKIEIDGVRVKAYIGIAPLNYSASGKISVVSSAQEVLPGSVDDRGVSKKR